MKAFCGDDDVAVVIQAHDRFTQAVGAVKGNLDCDAGVALPSVEAHFDISCSARSQLKTELDSFQNKMQKAILSLLEFLIQSKDAPDIKDLQIEVKRLHDSIFSLRKYAPYAIDKDVFKDALDYGSDVLFPVLKAVHLYKLMLEGGDIKGLHLALSVEEECAAACKGLRIVQNQRKEDGENKYAGPLRKLLRLCGGSGEVIETQYKSMYDWVGRFGDMIEKHTGVVLGTAQERMTEHDASLRVMLKNQHMNDAQFVKSMGMKDVNALKAALGKLVQTLEDYKDDCKAYDINPLCDKQYQSSQSLSDEAEYQCVRWAIHSFLQRPQVGDKEKGQGIRALIKGIVEDHKDNESVLKRLPMKRINQLLLLDDEAAEAEGEPDEKGEGLGAEAAEADEDEEAPQPPLKKGKVAAKAKTMVKPPATKKLRVMR